MENQRVFARVSERVDVLMGELLRGEHKKDILVNSAYDFCGETAAMYFSNTRNHLHSDLAYQVFGTGVCVEDAKILKGLKENE